MMVCRRSHEIEWVAAAMAVAVAAEVVVVAVAVAAITVPENRRMMCYALDIEDANDKGELAMELGTAHLWAAQFSGKWVDKQEGMQEGSANLINKVEDTASDGRKHLPEKAGAITDSTTTAKDMRVDFYNEVNKKMEDACNEVVTHGFSEEAKAKYEAMKEKASDAAGEVGAIMRH